MGGVAVYTVNLAKYLKKMGIEISVASGGGEMECILDEEKIPHFHVGIRTKSEFSPKVFGSLPGFIRLVKKEKFDLVHTQTRVAQVLAAISFMFTQVPFISTCHGFFKYKRLSRRLFPCWGEKIIAISKGVEKHLSDDFRVDKKRIEMIYNGIELERFLSAQESGDKPSGEDLGIGKHTYVIGSVGRLSSVKGFKYLIAAFCDVVKKHPDSFLLIVGEGKEKKALLKQINSMGISDKVRLEPRKFDTAKYLSVMDIFCLPSLMEGLGLSLMEAMAAGKACIASDIGGISELIKHGEDGMLFPRRDSAAISDGILRLIEDEKLRESSGRRAREKAENTFSIEDSVSKTIKVYREVVEEGRKTRDVI